MSVSPVTRPSLLVRIRDPNDTDAWRQFVDLYSSVIYGFARRRGLQDADAADLMQDVLRSVSNHAGRLEYDPKKGSFRGWLFTIARNKMLNFLNGAAQRTRGSGDSGVAEMLTQRSAPEQEAEEWDREYERRLFSMAAERVKGEFKETTWKAFWMTGVEGKDAKEAGAELKMSPGAVYVAKSRVLARLKEEVADLQKAAALE
jgi:RNA polymerase sigma factor (sigma-70 family)